jgi:hypothetical protein
MENNSVNDKFFNNSPFNEKNQSTENFINRPSVAVGLPVLPKVPDVQFSNLSSNNGNQDPISLLQSIIDSPEIGPSRKGIPMSSFSDDPRYSKGTRPGDNWEEAYAQNQTLTEKAINGVTKGLNLAATTVAGGFANVLVGLPAWALTGDITKIWNNPVNQGLQEWNEKVDREILPNFYTQQEQDAEWWSTDNWVTGNFLFDKLIKNSGYAVGAMVGGNIANALLMRAGAGIGAAATNLASKITTTGEMSQAFKLSSGLLKNTARAFSRGKNIEAYEASVGKLSSIADLAKREQQLAQLTKTTSKYANFGDNGRRTLVALYSSAGEASMEAIMGGNQMKDNLIQKYIDENGIEPTGQALEDINNTVREFGKVSFFGNMALLGLTEYVQLPYLAGSSWKNTRNAIKNTTNDVIAKGGKLVEDLPTTRFGKLYKGAKNYGKYVFDPKEAGQEIGQFALEVGTSNYFEKANETTAAEDWMDAVLNIPGIAKYGFFGRDEKGEGVGALVSKEGIEGGILGGITGGLMQAPMKFAETKARKTNTQRLIEESNNAPLVRDVVIDRINTANRGTVLQQQQQVAALQNDILESKDLKTDLAFNYAMHKVKYGRTDLVLDELADMKQQVMTGKEGFPELQGEGIGNTNDTKEEFLARITELETFVKDLDSTYEQLNTIYGAETIKDASTGELRRRFSDAAIERLAYATTKMKDYDARIPQLKSKLASKGIVVDQALSDVVNNPESTSIDEKLLEVDAFDSTMYTDADKNELKQTMLDVTDLTLRKKLFIDEFNQIIKKPENFTQNVSTKSSIETTEESDVPKNVIKIKTKAGDRNIEIGTEYFLGKRTFYSKDGKEVYRTPKLTILGENEDGTIKIKDSKGEVRDISKDELEDYKLAKVSSTLKNKVAKYYLEHMNSVFEFYGKKVTNEKGERVPVRGRLEYEQTEKGEKDKLFFVYKDEKGKIVRKEIDGSMVKPKPGYKHAIIKHIGNLTPAQQQAETEFGKTTSENVQAKLQRRADTLIEMYEEVLDKKQNSEKLIAEKTNKLEKLREEIAKITEQIETNKNPQDKRVKEFKFKKEIKDAIARVNDLSRMEQALKLELEELYSVDDELRLNVEYLEDLIENIEELPDSTKEFIAQLNDELIDLNIMVEETGKQINAVSSLIKATRDAINSAIKYLTSLVKSFESKYPNVPRVIGQDWIDYIQNNPLFKMDPSLIEDWSATYKEQLFKIDNTLAFVEEETIKPNETRLEDLNEHLDILQGALKDYENQIKVRENVLEKLEGILAKYKEQKRQEQELARNEKLIQEWVGTMDNSIQPVAADNDEEKVYEGPSKKSDRDVVQGTIPVSSDKRPHNLRSNRFGNRFNSFPEKKQRAIKGRIVTLKTEELQGVKGLSELITAGEASPSDVIAMVMVIETQDGTYSLVDEFGNAFTEEQKQNPLEHAVFQVFPSDKLEQRYMKDGKFVMETMFRETTDKDLKESLSKQYREWRASIMAQETLSPPLGINASFGLPEYVTRLVEKVVNGKTMQVEEIDYNATTPVEKTGLVSKTDLGNNKLVTVSTSNGVSEGSVTFNTNPGRVFLTLPGGLIKLNNRKLNSKEATSVYEAILQLSKIAFEKGTIKDDVQAQQIVRWLKTVVYWGIAKNPQTGQRKQAGYNNIWFEDVVDAKGQKSSKLFISGMGGNLSFTPSEISNRRSELISMIGALYHNVNKTLTDDRSWDNPYTEILGIDKNGETVTREWPNYQTYLLSSEGRTEEEIPLTTIVRPKTSENDVVKKGVYFTYIDNADTFNFELTKPAEVVAKETQPVSKQEAPVEQKPAQAPVASKLVFDNKTPNVYTELKSGNVTITLDKDGVASFVVNNNGELDAETSKTITNVVNAKNISEQEAQSLVLTAIEAKTKPMAVALATPVDTALTAAPVQEAPEVVVPTAPVSTDVKPENISSKGSEFAKKLTNVGNTVGLTYKGKQYVNSEHAYQTWKSGEFNQAGYDLKGGKVRGGKIGDTFSIMTDILIEKLKQHPELVQGIDERGGLAYIEQSTHNVIGDKFWESTGQNKFIEALAQAYKNIKSPSVSTDAKADIERSVQIGNLQITQTINSKGNIEREIKNLDNGKSLLNVITPEGKSMFFSLPNLNEAIDSQSEAVKAVVGNININAELDALEGGAKPVEQKPTTPTNNLINSAPQTNGIEGLDANFRIAYKEATTYPTENFNKLEAWLKANFPNIPIYRVKNIIQATNGRQAWGMLHKGAIYLYENAEIGTAYHEVFEAVWAMMTTPAERIAIAKDFRNRQGSYVDRFTGEIIKYSEATDDQMREELAEEFRDYVLYDKNPKQAPAPKTPSFLRKIFDEIINFFKSFFTGENYAQNTKELFDRIGNGYYAKYIPAEQKLSFAEAGYIDINSVIPDASSRFSLVKTIENISATEIHQLMQQMTSSTILSMIGNNEDLFNITKKNRTEMYNALREEILNRRIKGMYDQVSIDEVNGKISKEDADFSRNNFGTLYNNIANQWPLIQSKHQEYLLSYGITFDENDEIDYNEYEKSKDEGWGDARKIDAFKKLNSTIKLLLASVAETQIVDGKIRARVNNIGGVTLLPLGAVYVDLMNQLYESTDQLDMIRKFREISRQNPNYNALFTRIFKIDPASEQPIDYNKLNKSDLRIVEGFWKTFKKQSPTVSALFILPNGEVVVGDSNTSGLVREYRRQFLNNFITKARSNDTPYIAKNEKKGFIPTNKLLALQETQDLGVLVKFLDNIGIEFSEKKLINRKDLQKDFREATNGLIRSLKERITDEGIERINTETLNASGRLLELGMIKAKLESSEAETTYFNINGERSQTYLGPNLLSSFYDLISKVDNISELEGTNFGYLLTDSFSTIGSVMLNKIFDENGNKRKGVSIEVLKPFLVDGTINEESGKNTESSKLNKRQRYIQELNMNINGVYMNLVPGDANMQTAIKLHDKGNAFVTEDMLLNKTYMEIFKNQLLSEITMSRELDRPVAKNRNKEDLRFYKEILGETLHKKIVRAAQNSDISAEEIYNNNESEIKQAIDKFINDKANKSIDKLKTFGIMSLTEDGKYSVEDIALFNNEDTYTLENIRNQMKIQQMNFMIANTELHKLIYSDPYQYSDELKRIKNFSSPRQILSYGNSGINSRYNTLYNNEGEDKLFNTNFNRDTINGATISDVLSDNEELGYDPFEETDGGGIITDKGNRYIMIKNGEWTPENEEQYIYDMAYMKRVLGVKLSPSELERWKKGNPMEQSNYTPKKPIVAGNKDMGRSYNEMLLDKFALFPISFRMIHELNPDANMLKLYQKMIEDEVDYVVYQTGRKVGAENVYQLYNKNGSFNEAPLISEEEKKNPLGKQTVLSLPLSIFAIQTEVPTKENNEVTQGSQPTKLATMDYMEAGVPIDFMSEETDFEKRFNEWTKLLDKGSYNNGDNLYNELKNNQALLEARIENGLEKLFKKLGIKKTGADSYTLDKPELTFELLKQELLKREVNDNIVAALNGYEDGNFVLEAIPSYQQIRNILYSVAHKAVVSPKVKGGQKVQVSSALLESVRREAKEVNGKLVYSSDILKFYTNADGKRTCQIMISRWFNSPLSDEELMNYFNNTEEGKKQLSALAGVAFRIPTQKQNSIEAFEIAKFLPQGFGDSVIVPSALVKKVGSDFDIDKLFIYLKSLYTTKEGNLKVVPYFGIGEEAKSKIEELYDKGELDEYIKSVKNALPEGEAEDRLFKSLFPEEYAASKQEVVEKFYRESLDNAYISSFEKLVSHPLNFVNLVKPNSAKQMQDLTSEIEELVGIQKPNYMDVSLMLDREFMSELRNDFVRGKYNIGIAATSQTGNAQAQRELLTIDASKLNLASEKDRRFLKDASIRFTNYNSVKGMPTLSKIQDDNSIPEDRNYISDVIGQVIDGFVDVNKDPWVMRLGITTNTAGTWLFLIRLGVPLRDVAFFMNQPIIRDFLQTLENNGYSYLFSSNVIEAIKEDYSTKVDNVEFSTIPSETELKSMMDEEELGPLENAKQLFILDEFLKYAKMAEHLLAFTQATNFDTATFNDPFLVFKKRMQIERARKTIFSDVDNFLDASFIGKLRESIDSFRDGIAEILLSDKKDNPNGESIRSVLESVLMPYVTKSDADFISISKKAVLTLFDWAVQTDRNINTEISRVLLYKEGQDSVASRVMKLKREAENPKHPLHNNYVLKTIQAEVTEKPGEPDNLYISAKGNKVYDQNQIIYGLREIKKLLPENQKDLYGGIVRLAVLQSGLSNSRISYTSLLPFEDFVEVYNQTLSKIDIMPNLADFRDINSFERSNWNDTDLVPYHKEKVIKTKKGRWFKPETTMVSKKLFAAMNNGEIPRTINISTYSQEAQSDVITFVWSNMSISKNEKKDMIKRGDYSFMNKGLFKKVYGINQKGMPAPVVYETSSKDKQTGEVRIYKNYVYKMINAWGDSIYANEFYGKANPLIPSSTSSYPSVINNGYEKVIERATTSTVAGMEFTGKSSGEVEDSKIVDILGTSAYLEGDEDFIFNSQKESISLPEQMVTPIQKEYTPEKLTKENMPSNGIFVFGSNDRGIHGLGAAKTAMDEFGATRGQAIGKQGNAYAIRTKMHQNNKLTRYNELTEENKVLMDKMTIEDLNKLRLDALANPNNKFYVTEIGTKLAGRTVEEIKDLFKRMNDKFGIPDNIILPEVFEVRGESLPLQTEESEINDILSQKENESKRCNQ